MANDKRESLTYDDFKAVRDFGYVLAAPVFDPQNRYRGCLVVQVRRTLKNKLGPGKESRDEIMTSAATIGTLLFGS